MCSLLLKDLISDFYFFLCLYTFLTTQLSITGPFQSDLQFLYVSGQLSVMHLLLFRGKCSLSVCFVSESYDRIMTKMLTQLWTTMRLIVTSNGQYVRGRQDYSSLDYRLYIPLVLTFMLMALTKHIFYFEFLRPPLRDFHGMVLFLR